jgi:O-antigen ligase
VAPLPTATAAAALVSAVVLLPRLEWAALALVCASVFADWLTLLSAYATAWLTALLVLSWAVRRAAGPLHARCPAWVLLPAGVLTVVLVLVTAVHGGDAARLEATAAYAVPLAVFVVLVDCLSGPLAPRRAARAYVLACTLAALGALVAAVAGSAHRVAGPIEQPDELALFLLAAVPLAPTLARRRSGSRSAWSRSPRHDAALVTAVVAVLLLALLGTRSRPALLALLVVVALAVATRTLSVPRGGAFALAVATGAALVMVVAPRVLGTVIAQAQHDSDVGLGARVERWRAALELTSQAPVLGPGTGTGLDEAVGVYSTVLQASIELGVVGAVALLAVFVVPLLGARRRWRRDRSRLTAAVGLSLTGLLALSLVQTVQFALPLWLLAALAAALGQRNRGRLVVPDGPAARPVPTGGARGRS